MIRPTFAFLIALSGSALAVGSVLATPFASSNLRFAQDPAPWSAPARKARVKNPVAVSKESLALGKKLFETACFACHGLSGQGDGPAGIALNVKPTDLTAETMWKQSDGAIFWKLSTGRTPMPAFEGLYSDVDRWNIVNYMRSLAPKPEPVPQVGHYLDRVVEEYLLLHRVLLTAGQDDVVGIAKLTGLNRSLGGLDLVKSKSVAKENRSDWNASKLSLGESSARMAKARELGDLKKEFHALSLDLAAALKVFGYGAKGSLIELDCEHAFDGKGATWLQLGKVVLNPYLGPKMRSCGIKKREFGKVVPPKPDPRPAPKPQP
jgi:mono/diheme cytochrome c family protein